MRRLNPNEVCGVGSEKGKKSLHQSSKLYIYDGNGR